MDSEGRILYLCDPLRRDGAAVAAQLKREYPYVTALVFDENGRWLSQAQEAFAGKGFSGIAADGHACAVALAVAAQLQADRLMLRRCCIFDRSAARDAPVSMRRIIYFARRNLPLVAAEIQFADTAEEEIRRIKRSVSRLAQIEVCTEKNGVPGFFLRQ